MLYLLKEIYVRFLRQDCPPALVMGNYPASDKLLRRTTIHGCHRGGSSDFGPENTLYNYRRCVTELKTDVLEVQTRALLSQRLRLHQIDLRMTKDGEIVLIHDDTVDRTTNGKGSVSSFTLAEIKCDPPPSILLNLIPPSHSAPV